MLQFAIDENLCIKCGLCAKDCPVKIINLEDGYPAIAVEKEERCMQCQHCLAICPTGALSILGNSPADSVPLKGNLPAPEQLEILMKGRRTVRQYLDENLAPELIQQLLGVARHAPTGVNMDQVRFFVIDNKEALAVFRNEVYAALAELIAAGKLPENRSRFADIAKVWQEKGVDVLFRGAPHLVVTAAPKNGVCSAADCMIAMSYFELYAQCLGVGTVWNGLMNWTLGELVPHLQRRLGIPEDYLLGYVMAFGKPAIKYQRTVNRGGADVVYFKP